MTGKELEHSHFYQFLRLIRSFTHESSFDYSYRNRRCVLGFPEIGRCPPYSYLGFQTNLLHPTSALTFPSSVDGLFRQGRLPFVLEGTQVAEC